jgi:hypothetical protein
MMKFVGGVAASMFVAAIGSEWHPKADGANVIFAMLSAFCLGVVIGSIADSLREASHD